MIKINYKLKVLSFTQQTWGTELYRETISFLLINWIKTKYIIVNNSTELYNYF